MRVQRQFIGFRGEEELNKKLEKRREEVEKSREITDAEVRYQKMLKHLLNSCWNWQTMKSG